VLLHGPAGIGKKGLALDFAASLLCETPGPDARPCGRCQGCVLFQSRNHPDLRVVVPDALAWLRPVALDEDGDEVEEGGDEERRPGRVSREIKIEAVRAIGALVGMSAHRAGMRVVLIAPAEALNAPAANALLKMLEEPPPRTMFVLTSDRIDNVLPTICSRCVLVRLAPPRFEEAARWLRAQGIEDPDDLLAAAGGAPLPVLERDEDDGRTLSAATAETLLAALARGAGVDVIETGGRLPRAFALGAAIDLFQRWAWDLLTIRQTGRVRYHRKQREILSRLGAGVPAPRLLAWMDALKEARAVADHPLNARLVIEALLVDYAACLRGGEETAAAKG
jgi:DNA polymerase-3 subunit delta'